MKEEKNTVEELNLEAKIRKETIAELIAFLEDSAWRRELCTNSIPCKKKKDQEASINQNAGFRSAINLLKHCFTEGGPLEAEKFVAGK